MGKLRSLLKATMAGGLQIFNYQAKSEGAKRAMPLVLGALIGLAMLVSASTLTTELAKEGAQVAILAIYTVVTAVIIIMEGSYKASDLLFRPRDNDMLLAMPVKRTTIVLARMIKFYLFEMAYCLIFLLPAVVAYSMNAETGVGFWAVAVTMLVLVPVIPIAASCVVGLVVAAVAGRFRHKTLLQIILSFAMMFGMVGAVFMVNTETDFDGQNIAAVSEMAAGVYYPAGAFVRLAEEFDVGEYVLFVAVNLAVVAVAVAVIGRFCFQIITKLGTVNRAETRNAKYSFRRRSQTMAMVRKEMTRYFNTPVLLVNTAMGLVFFVVAVGLTCAKFDDITGSLMASVEDFPLTVEEMRAVMPGVTCAMVAFASLLTCITATMISLEGRAINVLKALPISGRKVLMTKVLAAMLLIVPVTAAGGVVMSLRFQFGVVDAILVLVGVVVMPLATELIGILINLKYPRFDADNDAVVVRQSASVMVATFLGLGMMLATVALTFGAVFLTGQTAGMAIVDGVYVAMALVLYLVIVTQGERKYLKLGV